MHIAEIDVIVVLLSLFFLGTLIYENGGIVHFAPAYYAPMATPMRSLVLFYIFVDSFFHLILFRSSAQSL